MLKESELLRYRGIFLNESRAYKSFSKGNAQVSIFLSHSHKDQELVEGFINFLAYSSQIVIYVDWLDSNMPRVTSRETARLIKQKIDELDYFLVLTTKNAMQSKWVPWEIGIADKTKPANRIAIVPVVDSTGYFHGNEYLQLYPSIQPGNNLGTSVLAVFEPNQNNGMVVRSWLSR